MTIAIKRNEEVKLIAPSSSGAEGSIESIEKYLSSICLKCDYMRDASGNPAIYGDDIFYANNNSARAEGFLEALKDDDAKLVWPVRGGKGASELLEFLDKSGHDLKNMDIEQKVYIGYSDSTAIMLKLCKDLGWDTIIHGSMLEELANGHVDPKSERILHDLLFGNLPDDCLVYDIKLVGGNPPAEGIADTSVLGGNLTLVESGIKTSWEPDFRYKIAFFEDTNSSPYSLERSFTHLRQAHLLDDTKAILLGDFVVRSEYQDTKEHVMQVVYERLAEWSGLPVFKIDGIGHGDSNNPLLFNNPSSIYSDDYGWHISMQTPDFF